MMKCSRSHVICLVAVATALMADCRMLETPTAATVYQQDILTAPSHETPTAATVYQQDILTTPSVYQDSVPEAPVAYQQGMPATISPLAATAAGSCGPVQVTKPQTRTLNCDLGNNTNTKMVYKPANKQDAKRFTPANFKFTCVANAGVGCDAGDNTGDPNNITKQTSCDSCALYASFCSRHPGVFVTNSQDIKTDFHALVMPGDPCTGVENWDQQECHGEEIWDQAASKLEKGGRTDGTWGMAINPVSKRGQHQMHVHLAQLYPNLIATVTYAYYTVYNQKKTEFHLDCGLGTNHQRLDNCTGVFTGTPTRFTPLVTIKTTKSDDPSQAKPFETVYGPKVTNITTGCNGKCNALESSLLVFKLPLSNAWALVANKAGPAECFFNPHNEDDLKKCK